MIKLGSLGQDEVQHQIVRHSLIQSCEKKKKEKKKWGGGGGKKERKKKERKCSDDVPLVQCMYLAL